MGPAQMYSCQHLHEEQIVGEVCSGRTKLCGFLDVGEVYVIKDCGFGALSPAVLCSGPQNLSVLPEKL